MVTNRSGGIRATRARPGKARAAGFTLIELMVVVAIAAVLTVAALPSFTQFVKNQRVKTASFDVFSSLVLARSEAITRNAQVSVTPSGGNWANGWQVTAGSIVVRDEDPMPNISASGPSSITFNGTGRLTGALSSGIELSATGSAVTTRCITVDLSGRPVTKAAAC